MKPLTIVIPPHDVIKLSPNDFLASGGEGEVYKKGNQLFKIYTNKLSFDLEEKVSLLSKLKHSSVIAPLSVIYDEQQHPIGFNMNYIKGEPLVKTFTNDWRNQENFTFDDTVRLVERLREITQFAHNNKALIVDGNELNYLVQHDKPFIIDVDSWQIGRFKATAIMNSIRDFSKSDFSDLTDWFSWAVITFQIFAGIHPYKGKHPDFKMGELEARVKQHVSVFNKETRVPQATRDFSTIPRSLKEWYISVFEEGKRSVPPLVMVGARADFTIATKQFRTVQTGTTSSLTFAKVMDFPLSIISVFPCGIVLLKDAGVYDSSGQKLAQLRSTKVQIVSAPISGYLAISEDHGITDIQEITVTPGRGPFKVPLTLTCQKVFRKENRVFVASGNNLTEVLFRRFSPLDNAMAMTGKSWSILENSTMFFKGIGVMNALKAMYMILPVGESGCSILRIQELDGHVPIDAVFDGNLISVIAMPIHNKGVDAVKFEITLSDDYSSYSVWSGKTDLSSELNIVVKNNVGITIVNDNELSVFSTKGGAIQRISDKNISTDMKLSMFKGHVHFAHGNSLWKLSM